MSADPDRALLAAALAFAGAAVAGSAVAIREDLPGQPCGISVPLSVPTGLLAGRAAEDRFARCRGGEAGGRGSGVGLRAGRRADALRATP